jgi:hypothetical protein
MGYEAKKTETLWPEARQRSVLGIQVASQKRIQSYPPRER